MCLFVKILCCELFFGFHRPNLVVYSIPGFFPSYRPIMKNCFPNCNLNKIHVVLCNDCIFSMILNVWYFFRLNPKCIFVCKNTGFGIRFIIVFCFSYYIFRKKTFQYWIGHSTFFYILLSLLIRFGIARNYLTIFSAHSSNDCILYLLFNLFCG